jgi:hypothetical protein
LRTLKLLKRSASSLFTVEKQRIDQLNELLAIAFLRIDVTGIALLADRHDFMERARREKTVQIVRGKH